MATVRIATLPLPADTRDGAGLARGAVLGVHARTRNREVIKRNGPKIPTEIKET